MDQCGKDFESLINIFQRFSLINVNQLEWKDFLTEITSVFESEMAILFKLTENGNIESESTFSYIKDNFSDTVTNADILNKLSLYLKEMSGKKRLNEILIVNHHEIAEYGEIAHLSIKAFITTLFKLGDKTPRVLFIATKKEKTESIGFPLFYDNNKKQLFEFLVLHFICFSDFEKAINTQNYELFKKNLEENSILISFKPTLLKLYEKPNKYLDVIIDLIRARMNSKKEINEIVKQEEKKLIEDVCKTYKEHIIPCFTEYICNSYSFHEKTNTSSKTIIERVPMLELSNSFLLSYFLYRVNKDLINDANLLNDYSPEEKWTFYKHIGKAIKYYFYTQQERINEPILRFTFKDLNLNEYIEAICHLIGEYANKYLKIERCFDVERHLKLFFSSQTLLYFMKLNYRDHLFHMVDICLLGFFLLSSKIKTDSKLDDLISKNSVIKNRDRLLKNWFIAALFHDIGYVLSLYDYVQKEVGFITSPEIDKIKNNLAAIQSKESTIFNMDFSQKLKEYGIDTKEISDLQALDHGVISAAHVMNIITKEYAGKEELEDKIEEYLPSISAMAHHNLSHTEQSIKIQPIGTLITLLDELQEWERQVIESLSLRDKLAASIRFNNPFASESKSTLEVIHIQMEEGFNPFTGDGHISKNGDLNFVLDYSGAKDQTEFKPIYAWLLKSHKLQRLSLNELFDVNITFINAIRDYGLEYNFLKDIRRKVRKWSFEEWMNIVNESHKREEDKEYLSIDVKELNDKKPLKHPPLEDLKALDI